MSYKPRRFGPRISLRLLLLAMLLCAVFFGGWAANERKHSAELEGAKAEAAEAPLTVQPANWTSQSSETTVLDLERYHVIPVRAIGEESQSSKR